MRAELRSATTMRTSRDLKHASFVCAGSNGKSEPKLVLVLAWMASMRETHDFKRLHVSNDWGVASRVG